MQNDRIIKHKQEETLKPIRSRKSLKIYWWTGLETPNSLLAPVSWSADLLSSGTALQLYHDKCYVATKDARVVVVELDGAVACIHQLPLAAASLMTDGDFLYAWCPATSIMDKCRGAVFDLSGREPRRVVEVTGFDTMAVYGVVTEGLLVVCNNSGSLAVQTLVGERRWVKEQALSYAGMLLADSSGIYVGHKWKVVKYSLQDGEEIWSYDVSGRHYKIECAQMNESCLFFVMNGKLYQLSKEDGSLVRVIAPRRHKASGIGVGPSTIITGSCPSIIFDLASGEEMYRMNFAGRLGEGCMQVHPSGRTFTAWDRLYCLDLSPQGVERALEGRSRASKEIALEPGNDCEELREVALSRAGPSGATVEVKTNDVGALTATPLGNHYHTAWPVLLPLPLLVENRTYIVQKLVPCTSQAFYRVQGHIFQLTSQLDKEADETPTANETEAGSTGDSDSQTTGTSEDLSEPCEPQPDIATLRQMFA